MALKDSIAKAAEAVKRYKGRLTAAAVAAGLAAGVYNYRAGGVWYVDASVAVSGDGTSRATAWKEMSNVVFTSVNAGDIIKVAGGTYQSELVFTKGGTVGNPITVMVDDDPAYYRDGVLLTGVGRVRLQGNSNIRLLGWAPGMDETGITNALVTTNLLARVGGRLNHTNGNANILATGTMVSNITVRGWLVDGTVNTNSVYTNVMGQLVFHPNDTPGNAGIGSSANDNVNWDISFNVIRNLGQDGIGITAAVPNTPDDVLISYNWIHDTGDDGIEITGGATVLANRIERTSGQNGHPDLLVIVGDGNAVVARNYMYGFNTFFGPFYGVKYRTFSNYWVVGNVSQYAFTNAGDNSFGRTVDQTPANSETNYLTTNSMVWRDNHTLYNTVVGSTPASTDVNRYRPNNTSNTNLNWLVVKEAPDDWRGNLFVDSGTASTVVGLSLKGNTDSNPNIGSGITYSPSVQDVLQLSHNILASTNQYGRRVLLGTNLVPWSSIVDVDAQFGTGPNWSNAPSFVSKGSFLELGDFRIPHTDTLAKAMGTNLTALGKPWLNVDFLGRPRPATGNWTIGAFEAEDPPYVETNLLVHLTFENDFEATGQIDDQSGFAHHGLRFGWSNPLTNFPTRASSAPVGNYFAAFTPYFDSGAYTDPAFHDGQYFWITNTNPRLTNMVRMTLMCWARYKDLPPGMLSTRLHNATFIDSGYSKKGTFQLGRYNSTTYGNTRFLVRTNDGSVAAAPQLQFPTSPDMWTNNVWHHYAVTIDCSVSTQLVAKLYFDGALWLTTNIVLQAANAVEGMRLTDAPGSTYGQGITGGAWGHNSTPPIVDDEFPNNGWLYGGLDEVKILDRVMSDAEIEAEYEAGDADATGGASTPPGRILRVTTARIGSIRRPRRKLHEHRNRNRTQSRAGRVRHPKGGPLCGRRPGRQGNAPRLGCGVLVGADRPSGDRRMGLCT